MRTMRTTSAFSAVSVFVRSAAGRRAARSRPKAIASTEGRARAIDGGAASRIGQYGRSAVATSHAGQAAAAAASWPSSPAAVRRLASGKRRAPGRPRHRAPTAAAHGDRGVDGGTLRSPPTATTGSAHVQPHGVAHEHRLARRVEHADVEARARVAAPRPRCDRVDRLSAPRSTSHHGSLLGGRERIVPFKRILPAPAAGSTPPSMARAA